MLHKDGKPSGPEPDQYMSAQIVAYELYNTHDPAFVLSINDAEFLINYWNLDESRREPDTGCLVSPYMLRSILLMITHYLLSLRIAGNPKSKSRNILHVWP